MTAPDFGTAALLSEPANYAVIQLPGRRFPGVVFQGDSLHALRESVAALTAIQDADELKQEATAIVRDLDKILEGYVDVVRTRGRSLPFDA